MKHIDIKGLIEGTNKYESRNYELGGGFRLQHTVRKTDTLSVCELTSEITIHHHDVVDSDLIFASVNLIGLINKSGLVCVDTPGVDNDLMILNDLKSIISGNGPIYCCDNNGNKNEYVIRSQCGIHITEYPDHILLAGDNCKYNHYIDTGDNNYIRDNFIMGIDLVINTIKTFVEYYRIE